MLDRSTEVEGLIAELMAWMKVGDSTGVSELFTLGAATLRWSATVPATGTQAAAQPRCLRSQPRPRAVPEPSPEPAAWAQVPVAWFADQVTAAFAQALIPLRNTGVAVRDGNAGASSRSSCRCRARRGTAQRLSCRHPTGAGHASP